MPAGRHPHPLPGKLRGCWRGGCPPSRAALSHAKLSSPLPEFRSPEVVLVLTGQSGKRCPPGAGGRHRKIVKDPGKAVLVAPIASVVMLTERRVREGGDVAEQLK